MEPQIGKNKKDHIRYYFVLLLDIMGQKEQLEKWSQLQPDGSVTAEMMEGIKGALGRVRRLRTDLPQFFTSFTRSAQQCTTALDIPAGRDRERYNTMSAPEIKLLHFSDMLIAHAPAHLGPGSDWNVGALHAILASVCTVIPPSLAGEIPLRGAVCIGTGVEAEEIGFYGPALSEAHRLESRVADYPRIVISDPLWEFIQSCPAEQATVAEKKVRMFFGECKSLVARDTDGRKIVDYLGVGSRELLGNSENLDSVQIDFVAKAYEFVTKEAERLCIAKTTGSEPREKSRTIPAEKYTRLKDYFDSRMTNWRKRPYRTGRAANDGG
jgi:hypothetical protein